MTKIWDAISVCDVFVADVTHIIEYDDKKCISNNRNNRLLIRLFKDGNKHKK